MLSALLDLPASATRDFIPYFLYKIGAYQQDYYLYFISPPNNIRYTNDIFNKLNQYEGYDIIKFLGFHYTAYPDKSDFLRFLKYQNSERLKRKVSKAFKIKLESVLQWLEEKQEGQQSLLLRSAKMIWNRRHIRRLKKKKIRLAIKSSRQIPET